MARRLAEAWASIRRSLVFIPLLIAFSSIALFLLTNALEVDLGATRTLEPTAASWREDLFFQGSATSAANIEMTIAQTWATIAGIAYSVLIVAIQLSATEYSTLVLPTFERDRLNQLTLGVFAGTVVYSLLVLRTAHETLSPGSAPFVPRLGVNVSLLLALVSVFLLVLFIGNIAAYIRPTRLVEGVRRTGARALPRLREPEGMPGFETDRLREAPGNVDPLHEPRTGGGEAREGRADRDGFVDAPRWDLIAAALTRATRGGRGVAGRPTGRLLLHVRTGSRVLEGDRLWSREGSLAEDKGLPRALDRAFLVSDVRDIYADPVYAVEALGDIAITAVTDSKDVGVAKASITALLRFVAADLALPPTRSHFRCGEIDVVRAPERVYAQGFIELARIYDRCLAENAWAIAEVLVGEARGPIVAAAVSREIALWRSMLAWVDPILVGIFLFKDRSAKVRMVHSLRRTLDALAQVDRYDEAEELADMIEAAAARGSLDPVVANALRGGVAADASPT